MNEWLDLAVQREAVPKSLRKETVEEFCTTHGVPVSTYYYNISKPETKKRILEITLNKAKDEAPEILEVLVEMAKNKDIRAIDIYMDSILQLAKNLDIKTAGRPIIQISQEIAEKHALTPRTINDSEGQASLPSA